MLEKYLSSILKFKQMWVFMPTLLFLLLAPQMVVGIFKFGDRPAYTLAGIVVLGFAAYLLTWRALAFIKIDNEKYNAWHSKFIIPSRYAVLIISLCYFALIFYALITSQKIALWQALSGASADDIAFAREALFKNRFGWEKSLVYFNAIFSSALMPFALALGYIEKRSYRHVLLVMFALSLLPSMEKVLILKALLPLIILGVNGYFPRKRVMQFAAIVLVVIAGTLYFTKMGKEDYLSLNSIAINSLQSQKENLYSKMNGDQQLIEENQRRAAYDGKRDLIDELGEGEKKYKAIEANIQKQLDYFLWLERYLLKYNFFGTGQLQYVVNRIFWIPYVTAYDWVGYFYEKLDGQYLLGKTSSLIARVTNEAQYPMEREVFKYQFGESGPQTAAANASFLVDAFVNFGWLGVALYSALFAALTWVVVAQANPAMQACYFYFAFQASMGGLTGVLFSNGMLFLIITAFFVRPKLSPPSF
jgi:hypothetical protein